MATKNNVGLVRHNHPPQYTDDNGFPHPSLHAPSQSCVEIDAGDGEQIGMRHERVGGAIVVEIGANKHRDHADGCGPFIKIHEQQSPQEDQANDQIEGAGPRQGAIIRESKAIVIVLI